MENNFLYSEKNFCDFKHSMDHYGWVIYEDVLSTDFVEKINDDLEAAYIDRRKIQEKNGISANMDGTLHHLVERNNFSIPFLEKMICDDEIRNFLGGNYILNGLNAVIHRKQEHPYLSNMHRDVRTFSSDTKMLLQMIVTLDDFTRLNGATYFLSGSHKIDLRPDETYFKKFADRAIAPQGSIILFNSNIWHAAGENYTDEPRRALTLGFTRPFYKQQFDYTRFLGYDFASQLKPDLQQVIGYNSRIPETLDEYYQPPELRMYQRDQG
ncbi:phytanoyl-CoA dioxygenase family protein [Mucilaginibacter xinganensis]|uniref:Ectoine hydroxylase-related dioxygenase, phytanoyl-CoA dioxygenase (PhyH) family n=1 Tax=Mucilaginibacter xinganensis TaxID=1234841 RepID=A0A223NY63_9SPHI|nr:phytanoyl-CoA dioxygenase family protein [Mucilaginibacter xinganensis]ASU34756.1 Ectoine hydroxylase-related dioxygenase, phytanoyl-CoA dioxygenase (PhyH) family [Mucilaginibacter xinganensis]